MNIGILGDGQLGRMLALAGYPLGLDFTFLGTSINAPAANLGELIIHKTAADLKQFIDKVDCVTFESENTPLALAEIVQQHKPLHPSIQSLQAAQHRIIEKDLFTQLNIPTTCYQAIEAESDLHEAVKSIGLPAILKTTTLGYDGKGQYVIQSQQEIAQAWQELRTQTPLILESYVNFKRELSLIGVRDLHDNILFYPLTETQHQHGILRKTITPAENTDNIVQQAQNYVTSLMQHLDHVGILALELFETDNGLFANEMAPRVHNSGHWSIEGAHTSQFENHLRAISDLPLGSIQPISTATSMLNIIGNQPPTKKILNITDAHLHLYNKAPRPSRKLGHVTILAESYNELNNRCNSIANIFTEIE